jgi:hypothetical protein
MVPPRPVATDGGRGVSTAPITSLRSASARTRLRPCAADVGPWRAANGDELGGVTPITRRAGANAGGPKAAAGVAESYRWRVSAGQPVHAAGQRAGRSRWAERPLVTR